MAQPAQTACELFHTWEKFFAKNSSAIRRKGLNQALQPPPSPPTWQILCADEGLSDLTAVGELEAIPADAASPRRRRDPCSAASDRPRECRTEGVPRGCQNRCARASARCLRAPSEGCRSARCRSRSD